MTPNEFTQSLTRDGFAAPVRVEREAHGTWGEHTHPFEAKALVLKGSIRIRTAAAGERTYAAGEVFHLAHEEPHAEWYGPEGVVYLAGRRAAGPGAGV